MACIAPPCAWGRGVAKRFGWARSRSGLHIYKGCHMSKKEIDYGKTAPGILMREQVERMGYSLLLLNQWGDRDVSQGVRVTELRVRLPSPDRPECLVVVKGMKDGQRLVGFHSGTDPGDTLKGAIERTHNGTMVWRGERPFGEESVTEGQ